MLRRGIQSLRSKSLMTRQPNSGPIEAASTARRWRCSMMSWLHAYGLVFDTATLEELHHTLYCWFVEYVVCGSRPLGWDAPSSANWMRPRELLTTHPDICKCSSILLRNAAPGLVDVARWGFEA